MNKGLATILDEASESAIEEMLIESEGEITKDIEERHMAVIKKVDANDWYINWAKARATFLKEEAKKLTEAARVLENRGEALKKYIKFNMERYGLSTLAGSIKEFSLQNSGKSLILDKDIVPKDYWEEIKSVELNKEKIKQDLDAGIIIPGAYYEPNSALYVRVKK